MLDVEFSNIQDEASNWPGGSNIGNDPEDNPRFLFASMRNYDIAWDSGCKDNGKNNLLPVDLYDLNEDLNVTENIPFDRAFRDREFDDTSGVGGVLDIGAFERHAGPVACPIDLNDDYTVDIFDLLILLGDWGSCQGCPADLNDDDVVDVFDLLILLGNWGHCEIDGGGAGSVPQTVQDCMDKYDPGTTELDACLEWVAEQEYYLGNGE